MIPRHITTELSKLAALGTSRYQLFYWRIYAGREVDFFIERGEKLIAVEVKWSRKLEASDLAGLRDCASALKGRL